MGGVAAVQRIALQGDASAISHVSFLCAYLNMCVIRTACESEERVSRCKMRRSTSTENQKERSQDNRMRGRLVKRENDSSKAREH